MQIVSGSFGEEEVHFEAPPSEIVKSEMTRFIDWYNETLFSIKSPLIKSAITHLYFESIHPFEDGNGRIGRILAEKAISQSIGKPVLLSISATFNENKPAYYQSLKNAQRSNNIDQWIKYFSSVIIKSQHDVLERIYFVIKKSKFFAVHNNYLNPRQIKVLAKMLEKNTTFEGGMNAQKYISITKTSKATATRDLQDLVAKEIFTLSGQAKNTSYNVNI
jgi:Fic family protein